MFPLALMTTPLWAQDTAGIISYQQIISLDIKDSELPEGMAALFPKEHKIDKVLYFNTGGALYENREEQGSENENEFKQDNMTLRIEHKVPEEITFTDLKNKKVTEQKDLMGRIFLITEDMDSRKWKLTGRQKKLLDLPCMEATYIHDKDTVVAWYTTAIPVSAGPESFSGLPGMILEVQTGANMRIVATAVSAANATTQKKIAPPRKGKKITGAEFEALAKQKQEEMQQQYGGKGNIMIMKQEVR